jgi:type II secretory pathway pseudopilin PulG
MKRNRSASSLVEVLICLGIVSTALIVTLPLLPQILYQQKQVDHWNRVLDQASTVLNQAISQNTATGQYPTNPVTLTDGTTITGQLIVADTVPGVTRNFRVLLQWPERSQIRKYTLQQRAFRVAY